MECRCRSPKSPVCIINLTNRKNPIFASCKFGFFDSLNFFIFLKKLNKNVFLICIY